MTFNVPTILNDMGSHRVHNFIVLFWPDDGFLQLKRVAKILKYCQFADICMLCF